MSENIQSISQGTYTIGQTSTANFIAGPGIKIDSPSAGTVRIGNDETVLYDSSALISNDLTLGTTFNISEPVTNFEKFKVYYTRFPWTDQCPTHQIQEFDSTVHVNVIVLHTTFTNSTATKPTWYDCSETITDISGTTWKLNSCIQRQLYNGTPENTYIYLKPYKVIGINRISGNA